ncbi:MAG: transposase, partial [Chloroflexi bacterium]|nr:transposase [Chloroflexota bacterium]
TSITYGRKPLYNEKENQEIFYTTIRNSREIHQFKLLAQVLLPDHFHWLLEIKEQDFSKIVKTVKGNFTRNFKNKNNVSGSLNLWQPRYWDHVIRNEIDLINHLEYIH